MCGRYTPTSQAPDLIQRFLFDTGDSGPDFRPRFNVAPGQAAVAVVATAHGSRRAGTLRRGLVPPWSNDGRPGPINARSETAAAKRMFRRAMRTRRCLVLADSFYEWARTDHQRVLIRFALRGGEPFCSRSPACGSGGRRRTVANWRRAAS